MSYLTAVLVAGILVLAWNLYRAHVIIANLTLVAYQYKVAFDMMIECADMLIERAKVDSKVKNNDEGLDEKDR